MRPRSAAILAVRIIALVIGIQGIMAFVALSSITSQFGDNGGTGPFWALVAAHLVIAIALWRFAEDLSRPMSRGTDDESPMAARRTANIAAVAFSVLGLFLITEAVTDFVATLANSFRIGSQSPYPVFHSRARGSFRGASRRSSWRSCSSRSGSL